MAVPSLFLVFHNLDSFEEKWVVSLWKFLNLS